MLFGWIIYELGCKSHHESLFRERILATIAVSCRPAPHQTDNAMIGMATIYCKKLQHTPCVLQNIEIQTAHHPRNLHSSTLATWIRVHIHLLHDVPSNKITSNGSNSKYYFLTTRLAFKEMEGGIVKSSDIELQCESNMIETVLSNSTTVHVKTLLPLVMNHNLQTQTTPAGDIILYRHSSENVR